MCQTRISDCSTTSIYLTSACLSLSCPISRYTHRLNRTGTANLGIEFKHTGKNVLRRQKCWGWAVLRCLLWPSLFRVLYAYPGHVRQSFECALLCVLRGPAKHHILVVPQHLLIMSHQHCRRPVVPHPCGTPSSYPLILSHQRSITGKPDD